MDTHVSLAGSTVAFRNALEARCSVAVEAGEGLGELETVLQRCVSADPDLNTLLEDCKSKKVAQAQEAKLTKLQAICGEILQVGVITEAPAKALREACDNGPDDVTEEFASEMERGWPGFAADDSDSVHPPALGAAAPREGLEDVDM